MSWFSLLVRRSEEVDGFCCLTCFSPSCVRDMGWEMIGEKTGIHKSFTINSSHATGLELLEPPRSSSTKLLFCPNLLLIIFKPHTVSPSSKKIKLCILDKINKSEAICNSMSQIHLGPARDEQVYFGCKNMYRFSFRCLLYWCDALVPQFKGILIVLWKCAKALRRHISHFYYFCDFRVVTGVMNIE